jgi:hypothetical protein
MSNKYPSTNDKRDDLIEEYRQCKTALQKIKERFEDHVYVYISTNYKNNTKLKLELTAEEAYNFSHIR